MTNLISRVSAIRSIIKAIETEANKVYLYEYNLLRQSDEDRNYSVSDWIAIINYYATKAYVFNDKTDEAKKKALIRSAAVAVNAIYNIFYSNRQALNQTSIRELNDYFGAFSADCLKEMYRNEDSTSYGILKIKEHQALYSNGIGPYNNRVDIFQALGSTNDICQNRCSVEIIVKQQSVNAVLCGFRNVWPGKNVGVRTLLFSASYDKNEDLAALKSVIIEMIKCFFIISEFEIENRPLNSNEEDSMYPPVFRMRKSDEFGKIYGRWMNPSGQEVQPFKLETYRKMDAMQQLVPAENPLEANNSNTEKFVCESYNDRSNLIDTDFAFTGVNSDGHEKELGLNGKDGIVNHCIDYMRKNNTGSYRITLVRGKVLNVL